jgi:hypothetical protein
MHQLHEGALSRIRKAIAANEEAAKAYSDAHRRHSMITTCCHLSSLRKTEEDAVEPTFGSHARA